MTPVEVLNMALEKEIEAIKIYTDLSLEHPAIKDLLLFLADEEQKHKRLIEKKIYEISK